VSAFLYQWDIPRLKELHQLCVEHLGEAVPHPAPVRSYVGDEVLDGSCVGEVAATLSGDAQFAPWLVHFLQQHHLCPQFGGSHGGHHASGTGSHNDDTPHDFEMVKISAG
jgi:hypothetical protein